MPTISIDTAANAALIKVVGGLDMMSSHLLNDAIVVAGTDSVVLVSLEDCSSLDSTILSVLVRHHRHMAERFVLVAPKGSYVRRILEMCGLDSALHIVSSLPDGIKRACLMRASA
jgi:anti-anti-sigma factor